MFLVGWFVDVDVGWLFFCNFLPAFSTVRLVVRCALKVQQDICSDRSETARPTAEVAAMSY